MSKLILQDIGSGYNLATVVNNNNDFLEDAFDNTVSRDGSAPNGMLAPLDMNSHPILNLGAPTSGNDAARWVDVTDAVEITGIVAPALTGNAGKFLQTDGSTTAWQYSSAYYVTTDEETAAGVTVVDPLVANHLLDGKVRVDRYGTNDDTAIQAALDVAEELGGAIVQFNADSYTITSTKEVPNGTSLVGAGQEATIINISGAIIGFTFATAVHVHSDGKHLVTGIGFVGSASALGALHFDRRNNITVRKNSFTSFPATNAYGIKLTEVYFWTITENYFEFINKYGVVGVFGTLTGPNGGVFGPSNEVIGNNQGNFIGLSLDSTQNAAIYGNDFEGSTNGLHAIELTGCDGIHIHSNYIELWTGRAIKIDSGALTKRVLIEQNVINSVPPAIDLDNPAINTNIVIRQNRFADIGVAGTCIDPGTTTHFYESDNDPDLGNITTLATAGNKSVTRVERNDTGTLTGCTTAPTGTVRQERIGQSIVVQMPALTATSNSTSCSLTGAIGVIWRPARTQVVIGRCVDNGIDMLCLYVIDTTGVFTIYNAAGSSTFFTGSGTKGFSPCTFTYSLN